jgi:DNA polymerase III delta subunit
MVPGDPLLALWVRRHLLFLSGIQDVESDTAIDTRPGEEMAQYRILTRLRERPLFGSGRILWITRADQSPEIDPEELLGKSSGKRTTVILEGPEKLLSTWSKKIPVFHLAPPSKPAEREMWISFLAKKQGLTLHKSAIEPILTTFEEALGPVDRLFRDIGRDLAKDEKRAGSKEITEEVLEKYGITNHYKTVFDLIRGLEGGEKKFFREWKRFLENGQSPFGLLSLLHRQWKLYRIGKSGLSEQGGTPGKAEEMVASIGGVPPFIARTIVRTARRMSHDSLRKGIDALWEADSLLKSGLKADIVMDRLAATLYTLTAPNSRPEPSGKAGPPSRSGSPPRS